MLWRYGLPTAPNKPCHTLNVITRRIRVPVKLLKGSSLWAGYEADKHLRIVALAALKAGKDVDEPSKYAARARR